MGFDVGGFTQKPNWPRLRPTLVIASSLILAIRTARWPVSEAGTHSTPGLAREVAYAVRLAGMVLGVLVAHHESFFFQCKEPWFVPNDDDTPG
jgi:hypothetical protein